MPSGRAGALAWAPDAGALVLPLRDQALGFGQRFTFVSEKLGGNLCIFSSHLWCLHI